MWKEALLLCTCDRELSQVFFQWNKWTEAHDECIIHTALHNHFLPNYVKLHIFVFCWFKISGFYCFWDTIESMMSTNLPFSWEFHPLGMLPSQEGIRLPHCILHLSQLCPSLQHHSGSWGLQIAPCIPWEYPGSIMVLINGAHHPGKFILFDSLENWEKRNT